MKRVNAPFKAPRLLRPNESAVSRNAPASKSKEEPALFVPESPELISSQSGEEQRGPVKRVKANPPVRLHTLKSSPPIQTQREEATSQYYTVQWRKRSNKKNKLWEGDGYIVVSPTGIVLKADQKGNGSFRPIGRTSKPNIDGVIVCGGYEAEVDSAVTREEIQKMVGGGDTLTSSSPVKAQQYGVQAKFKPVKLNIVERESPEVQLPTPAPAPKPVPVVQDSAAPFMLPSPNVDQYQDVIVDSRVSQYLRPHQREGVTFVYECLMGFKNSEHTGVLLADEMGLGKTLMTISVIWTLLKQSPYPNTRSEANKVLICCPVSLIDNWHKEFKKWLDINRIGILALNGKQQSAAKDKQDIVNFGKTKVYQVLIMSYEKVLSCAQELSTVNFDLLVCDEGHRLKSGSNKVLKVLNSLGVPRKLVLTGTPIQNDLNEFYNIVNFINPGILGSQQEFQKLYLRPILQARDVNCTNKEVMKEGKLLSSRLIELTKGFMLRRTKSVIKNYLTTKTDAVLFCPPTKLQKKLFELVLGSTKFSCLLNSDTRDVLSLITVFRKICNSPSLLSKDQFLISLHKETGELDPSTLSSRTTGSKINVLIPLLIEFQRVDEKVVLVSNYTQTLDFLAEVLQKLNIKYSRLDGATPGKTRDKLVLAFNKNPSYEVFLLSAKAGGVGLNLVGASRLVLFDNDWNPLVDLQAMARIHRDGQTKPVFIYRLVTTGAIDEKIFQRQLMKNNLSDMFLDDNVESTLNVFDFQDLRDLFTVADTNCNTHDLLDCDCLGTGEEIILSQLQNDADKTEEDIECPSLDWMSALDLKSMDDSEMAKKRSIRSALSHYRHFDPSSMLSHTDTGDDILNKLMLKTKQDPLLTYVFTNITQGQQE